MAARIGDMVLQDAPHCHAPIHPPAPVPTPVPHPALPLAIIKGVPTVLIGGMPAATVTSTTVPCMLPGCVPAGPGIVVKASATCRIRVFGSRLKEKRIQGFQPGTLNREPKTLIRHVVYELRSIVNPAELLPRIEPGRYS